MSETDKGLTYKFGNILFQINADTGAIPRDRLEKFKMTQDNFVSQIPNLKYLSELKTFSDKRVVLISTESADICYYHIMAGNRANNKILFATMEYYKTDEIQAKNFLNYFLNHLKFK